DVTSEGQREQGMRSMARRGATVIAVIGFGSREPLARIADEFRDARFCLIDSQLDRPNVRSIQFKEHEGSFLVGMVAGLATHGGKVGFIGGMDIPLLRTFLEGYRQGVRFVAPAIQVVAQMIGTTPAAWYEPGRAGELAKQQFTDGVEVIYAAAGGSS